MARRTQYPPWSAEELEAVRAGYANGVTAADIAAALGRTMHAVHEAARRNKYRWCGAQFSAGVKARKDKASPKSEKAITLWADGLSIDQIANAVCLSYSGTLKALSRVRTKEHYDQRRAALAKRAPVPAPKVAAPKKVARPVKEKVAPAPKRTNANSLSRMGRKAAPEAATRGLLIPETVRQLQRYAPCYRADVGSAGFWNKPPTRYVFRGRIYPVEELGALLARVESERVAA